MPQISLKHLQRIIREELAATDAVEPISSAKDSIESTASELEQLANKNKFSSDFSNAIGDLYKALGKLEKLGSVKGSEEFESIKSAIQKLSSNPSQYMGDANPAAPKELVATSKKVVKPQVKNT